MFSFWEKGALVCLVTREREREREKERCSCSLVLIAVAYNAMNWNDNRNEMTEKKLKMTHKFKWENQRARDLMAQSMIMQQAGDWCSKFRFEIFYFFRFCSNDNGEIRLLCFSSFKFKHFYLRFFVHVWSVWIIKKIEVKVVAWLPVIFLFSIVWNIFTVHPCSAIGAWLWLMMKGRKKRWNRFPTWTLIILPSYNFFFNFTLHFVFLLISPPE